MKILCTGATSFLGAPLARRLAKSGHAVKVLSRSGRTGRRLVNTGIEAVQGDVRDPHAVARAVYGCESVVHLAYAPVSSPAREVIDTAVLGMASVLRACEAHSVRDLLLVSSARVMDHARPLAPEACYGEGKRAAEAMAAAWCRDGVLRRAIIARVFGAYGPDMGTDHVIPQFIARMDGLNGPGVRSPVRFPVKGTGRDVRSFAFVDDCVRQLHALLDRAPAGAAVYDVGDPGTVLTIGELAVRVGACFGRELTVVPSLAEGPVTRRVPGAGIPAPVLVSFTEGLGRTVAWYKANGMAVRGG